MLLHISARCSHGRPKVAPSHHRHLSAHSFDSYNQIIIIIIILWGRDSLLDIVTRLRDWWPENRLSIFSTSTRSFAPLKPQDRAWGHRTTLRVWSWTSRVLRLGMDKLNLHLSPHLHALHRHSSSAAPPPPHYIIIITNIISWLPNSQI